jgi:hypothetical protein
VSGSGAALTKAVRALSDTEQRVTVADIARLTELHRPGMYAWYVDADGAADLTRGLGEHVGAGLIYAGLTGAGSSNASLRSRISRNHVRGNIRGSTFRLTLAAALAQPLRLRPEGFRLMGPANEKKLTIWIQEHLMVAVHPYPDSATLDALETGVLATLDPPLNLAKMPPTQLRSALSAARHPFMRKDGV